MKRVPEPILTDEKGVPFERPKRENFVSELPYLQALCEYRDRVTTCANRAFALRIVEALKETPTMRILAEIQSLRALPLETLRKAHTGSTDETKEQLIDRVMIAKHGKRRMAEIWGH